MSESKWKLFSFLSGITNVCDIDTTCCFFFEMLLNGSKFVLNVDYSTFASDAMSSRG